MNIQIANFKTLGNRKNGTAAIYNSFGPSGFYVGRENKFFGLSKSPLANPFRAKNYSGQKGDTLPDYRKWLWTQVKNENLTVIDELNLMIAAHKRNGTLTLVCWCDCKCHAEIIRNALNSEAIQNILKKHQYRVR
jgi:hypothetical protein